jgi:hypothetical protein
MNGKTQVFEGVNVDRFYHLKQDGGLLQVDRKNS